MIVDGGTAGCIVAARRCGDPTICVCLLEVGPSDGGDDAILVLDRWMRLLDSGDDRGHPVDLQEKGSSFLRHHTTVDHPAGTVRTMAEKAADLIKATAASQQAWPDEDAGVREATGSR